MDKNTQEILDYATSRGLKKASLTYHIGSGWELYGEGADDEGRPLVQSVATECGISFGCGSSNLQQVKLGLFLSPNAEITGSEGVRVD